MTFKHYGWLAIATVLSGCAAPTVEATRAVGAVPGAAKTIDVTPFLKVQDQIAGSTTGVPNDTYVKLNVRGFDEPTGKTIGTSAETKRVYVPRGWLARFLFGTSYGLHLNAKVSVTPDPKIDTTIPLLAMTHDSNTEVGEAWYTSLIDSDQPLPYFRVRSNAKLSAVFEFKRSDEVSSDAIKTVLSVVREASNALAPGSNVVTHLSKDAVKQRADLYDQALGKLFSTSITESRTSAATSNSWTPGQGYTVTLSIPGDEESLAPDFKVGRWEITVTQPVVSVYIPVPAGSDRAAAEASVMKSVKSNEVLGYKVSDQVSLYGYMAAQSWFTDSAATIAAGGTGADSAAGQFCQKIVTTLDSLLLNDLDSRLGLWAVSEAMPMPQAVADAMAKNARCQAYVSPIRAARS